ncbi:MAG: hypothetical protein ABJR46_17230 [Tateyamaria sp.]|uniref:hypothetical protein n=1 Tax=Tateyamaria sp. TaxID=1929288 RepID=UPI00329D2852
MDIPLETGLTQLQTDFIHRFIVPLTQTGPTPTAQTGGSSPIAVSIQKLGKARLDWKREHANLDGGVLRLKTAIRAVFASKPDAMQQVETGLKKLDTVLSVMDDTLHTQLDDVLTAQTESARAKHAQASLATLEAYAHYLETDPVAGLIDANGFDDSTPVVAPMKEVLRDIRAALTTS